MSTDFVLEDPPPVRRDTSGFKSGGRGRIAPWMVEAIAFAEAHAGRWVRVRAFDYPPSEVTRRLKRLGLDATTRRDGPVYQLYVRASDEVE